MGRAPWLLLCPRGVLHYCQNEQALLDIAKEQGIKPFNLKLQVAYEDENGQKTQGNTAKPVDVKGWTGFNRLEWLRHESTGRVVFVHGKHKAWVERACASSAEWAEDITKFNAQNFSKFLNDNYNGGKPYQVWERLKSPPVDAETRVLRQTSTAPGKYSAMGPDPAIVASTSQPAAAKLATVQTV